MFALIFYLQLIVVNLASNFNNGIKMGIVRSKSINEASGLAASRRHTGILYTHNDRNDGPYLYVINSGTGNLVSTITVNGAQNSDWEDIAYGPCDGGYCIYIGDTGDAGSKNIIYVIREPAVVYHNQQLDVYKKLHFSWPERDCETLLVDPQGEIYIVSKVKKGHTAKAAHVPRSAFESNNTVVLTNLISLTFRTSKTDPTGGDLSPNRKELLIISHKNIYYWNVTNDGVLATLMTDPTTVPHVDEPQPEAVCWDANGDGYFTLSEGENQPLYYYSRS